MIQVGPIDEGIDIINNTVQVMNNKNESADSQNETELINNIIQVIDNTNALNHSRNETELINNTHNHGDIFIEPNHDPLKTLAPMNMIIQLEDDIEHQIIHYIEGD